MDDKRTAVMGCLIVVTSWFLGLLMGAAITALVFLAG